MREIALCLHVGGRNPVKRKVKHGEDRWNIARLEIQAVKPSEGLDVGRCAVRTLLKFLLPLLLSC